MSETSEAAAIAPPRRRRRSQSSKTKPEPQGPLALIRGRPFARLVFAAMGLVAAADAYNSYRQVEQAGQGYGPVAIGGSIDALRAVLGQPASEDRAAGRSRFVHDGRELQVSFDPASGRVSGVVCRETGVTSAICPGQIGIVPGSSEAEVLHEFGPPAGTREQRQAALAYPAIGTRFELAEQKVSAISVSSSGRTGSVWPIVMWRMLP